MMRKGPVLVVDDEPTQLRLLSGMIERAGHEVETAADGTAALARIRDRSRPAPACMILDLQMPGMGGQAVLKELATLAPDLPVIVLTAHSGLKTVVEVMRAGAADFIVKPASAERIKAAIEGALSDIGMTGPIAALEPESAARPGFSDLIGASPAMKEAIRLAKKAARTSIPVLIEGASGVGKEMFARAIHKESDRAAGPFVAVNCGAIPEALVESILFGHEKGSFTGASERHIGKFVEASGGTLFLDEIGELPLDMQVKLLRALQEGEVDPVGARQPVRVDIRLISATNRDMAAAVASGALREDLYYRLNVFPLRIPSLSERREDIPLLARHFISVIARSEDLPEKQLDEAALDYLCRYDWPGNIRQLQNAVFRAVVMSEDDRLGIADFPQIRQAPPRDDALAANGTGTAPADLPADMMAGMAVAPAHAVSLLDPAGRIRPLAEIEADAIRGAIAHCNGRLSEVARRLGIGRSTLYRRIEELGLENEARLARHGTMPALDRP